VAFGAAFLAGAINSVAGGGTLVSFRADLARPEFGGGQCHQHRSHLAGTVGSAWGYRREAGRVAPRMWLMVVPSLAGGLAGAWLLHLTPPGVFDRLVPF